MRNKEVEAAAETFYNDFILNFGLPGSILHNQGKEFENGVHRRVYLLHFWKEYLIRNKMSILAKVFYTFVHFADQNEN